MKCHIKKMICHIKKMIAPIAISVAMILYYIFFFYLFFVVLPNSWKVAFGLFTLVISVLVIKACIERINEIRKGEEDDISKY